MKFLALKMNTLMIWGCVIAIAACAQSLPDAKKAFAPFTSVSPSAPDIFGPDWISTMHSERDIAIAPDSSMILFTRVAPGASYSAIIAIERNTVGGWKAPEIASFSGQYRDLEPVFSPDGKWLYFASNRPIAGDSVKDFDIWRVARLAQGWGTPENLGPTINGPGHEFFPSVAASGNLYFTAQRPDAIGLEDIYRAVWTDSGYQTPVPLDTGINTRGYEFNAHVFAGENAIIFSGYQRKDGLGGADLYYSEFHPDGYWLPAINMGPDVNGPGLDYCPFIFGNTLFYTSEARPFGQAPSQPMTLDSLNKLLAQPGNGNSDIYWYDYPFEIFYDHIDWERFR